MLSLQGQSPVSLYGEGQSGSIFFLKIDKLKGRKPKLNKSMSKMLESVCEEDIVEPPPSQARIDAAAGKETEYKKRGPDKWPAKSPDCDIVEVLLPRRCDRASTKDPCSV